MAHENIEEKIDKAFAEFLGDEINKADGGENVDENSDEEDDKEDDEVEKAVAVLKKGKYSDDDKMIAALKKAGYGKDTCKAAMSKYKKLTMKKSIDNELNFDNLSGDDDFDPENVNKGVNGDEIDVTELLENIPVAFENLETNIQKGLNTNNNVGLGIAKALKIIGSLAVETSNEVTEIKEMIKAIAGQPIQKGVKGEHVDKKFDKPKKDGEKEDGEKEDKEDEKIIKGVRDSDQIQEVLLKIDTMKSREALRNFVSSRSKDMDILIPFKSELEKSLNKTFLS